jgi:hypothetical protein
MTCRQGATSIPSLPFAIDQNTTEASVESDDVGCGAGGLDAATVWYSFTPSDDVRVEIDATASDYLVGVNLFAGTADEAGRFDCNNDAVAFDAAAGIKYFLLFADVNDDSVNGGTLRAEVGVAPPSLNVSLGVAPTAKVHPKTGQARVTGTITCDRPAEFAEVSVALRLGTGRFFTIGSGAAPASCGPAPSAWAAIVTGENGRFTAGSATVDLTGLACDILTCSETATTAPVRLRRGVFELPAPKGVSVPTQVKAAAPANDDIASPTLVGSLPFSDSLDTTGATTRPTDPGYCFDPAFGQDPASVWYAYTATEAGPLLATTFGSDYDTTLYVGTADGAGGVTVLGCSDDTRTHESAVRFDAIADETYLFVASTSPFVGGNGGNLVFNLDVGPPGPGRRVARRFGRVVHRLRHCDNPRDGQLRGTGRYRRNRHRRAHPACRQPRAPGHGVLGHRGLPGRGHPVRGRGLEPVRQVPWRPCLGPGDFRGLQRFRVRQRDGRPSDRPTEVDACSGTYSSPRNVPRCNRELAAGLSLSPGPTAKHRPRSVPVAFCDTVGVGIGSV